MKNVKLLRYISKLRGNDYTKEYHKLKDITDPGELDRFIKSKLVALLIHANKNVPYYKSLFSKINLIENDEINLTDFYKIPILTREDIRVHGKDLISTDHEFRKCHLNYSGGSVGEPIKFMQDSIYIKWRNAINRYYLEDIIGVDEWKTKKIILWGSERDLFKGSIGVRAILENWLINTKLLNSFRMSDDRMESYIRTINSYKPELIRGYTGSLYELSRYVNKNSIFLEKPNTVICAAETLNSDMRTQIEKAFKTKVYNFYGSREVSSLAGECSSGLLHVFSFWNYIEILDDNNKPVEANEQGKVVVTNLFNYSMPLIRYEIGDIAIRGPETCACGCILPTIRKITGRITDHFVLRNGSIVPAEFFIHLIGVLRNDGRIKKFQVIQEDYNLIKILYITDSIVDNYIKKDIDDKIKIVMGNDCNIVWTQVEDIPKTRSGKYIYTKSLLWKNR